jgi:hypothetical protein
MPRGITSKFYINANPGYLAPAWLLVDLISDFSAKADWNEGEGSTRREVQQVFEPTNMNLTITGKIRKDVTDLPYSTIRAAHHARGPLDVLVLDGLLDVTGSDGFRFDVKVTKFTEDQSLGVVVFNDFELTPCLTGNGVYSALVVGGVLTFTQLTNDS